MFWLGPAYAQGQQLLPNRDQRDSDDDDDDDLHNDTGMGALPTNIALSASGLSRDKLQQRTMLLAKPKKTNFKKQKALQAAAIARKQALLKAEEEKNQAAAATAAPRPWYAFWRTQDDAKEKEKESLLNKDGEANDVENNNAPQKSEEEKKKDDDDEAKEFITTIKNMTGLWDIDPDDSAYVLWSSFPFFLNYMSYYCCH